MKTTYAFSLFILIVAMFLSACSKQDVPENTTAETTAASRETETVSPGTSTEKPAPDQPTGVETSAYVPTSSEAKKSVADMTEKELVEAIADYRYLVDIYASSVSFGDGLDGLARHCPAFAELKTRENWQAALEQYGNELIEQYKQTPRSDGRTEFVSGVLTDIIQYVTGEQPEETKPEIPGETSAAAETETTAQTGERSDIPVYAEDYLLFNRDNDGFYLGRDAAFYYNYSARQNAKEGILRWYPTDAVRLNNNGSMYTVHETDSGYRLYLFYDQSRDYSITIGFPIVVRELLSFSAFSDLKPGDSMEAVEAIDPVAGLHKKIFTEIWKLGPKGTKSQASRGYPCTSVHYLTDGLLRIEYEMTEEWDLFITKIELSEDYTLTDPLGRKVDYKIEETDLPKP